MFARSARSKSSDCATCEKRMVVEKKICMQLLIHIRFQWNIHRGHRSYVYLNVVFRYTSTVKGKIMETNQYQYWTMKWDASFFVFLDALAIRSFVCGMVLTFRGFGFVRMVLTFWIGESSLEIAKSNHKTENCMPFALCVAFWSVWSFENSSLEAPAYAFGSPFGATWLILGAIGVPSGRQRGTKILFVRTMFGKRVGKWVQKRYQKNTWELNRKLIPKWEPLTC